jgi:hypothetical protein
VKSSSRIQALIPGSAPSPPPTHTALYSPDIGPLQGWVREGGKEGGREGGREGGGGRERERGCVKCERGRIKCERYDGRRRRLGRWGVVARRGKFSGKVLGYRELAYHRLGRWVR